VAHHGLTLLGATVVKILSPILQLPVESELCRLVSRALDHEGGIHKCFIESGAWSPAFLAGDGDRNRALGALSAAAVIFFAVAMLMPVGVGAVG
jgi:hypothetical protein